MNIFFANVPFATEEEIHNARTKYGLEFIFESDVVFDKDDIKSPIITIFRNRGNMFKSKWVGLDFVSEEIYDFDDIIDKFRIIYAVNTPYGYLYSRAFHETCVLDVSKKRYKISGGRMIAKTDNPLTPLYLTDDGFVVLQ